MMPRQQRSGTARRRRKQSQRAETKRRAGTKFPKQLVTFAEEVEAQRIEAFERAAPKTAAKREVKIVAEGDSWFSYLPPYDILAQLRNRRWKGWDYDVEDRASAGATLNDMVYGRHIVDTYELLDRHRPDVFLFSGGGNDVAGPELFVMLYHHKAVELSNNGIPEINKNIIQGLVDEVFSRAFSDLIGLLRFKMDDIGKPNMPIIFHGYDYAIPDGRGWAGGWPLPGPWLDPSLTRKGYDITADARVRQQIVRDLIDAFNRMLDGVVRAHPHTHYVDLRGTLSKSDWGNELHPTRKGFLKVTKKIEERIRREA
jgi:hypothetical protein